MYVRLTVRYVIHLTFNISSNALKIRAFKSPKCAWYIYSLMCCWLYVKWQSRHQLSVFANNSLKSFYLFWNVYLSVCFIYRIRFTYIYLKVNPKGHYKLVYVFCLWITTGTAGQYIKYADEERLPHQPHCYIQSAHKIWGGVAKTIQYAFRCISEVTKIQKPIHYTAQYRVDFREEAMRYRLQHIRLYTLGFAPLFYISYVWLTCYNVTFDVKSVKKYKVKSTLWALYRSYFKGISTNIELQVCTVTCCWPYVIRYSYRKTFQSY
jgi:hypothetical protein